MAPSEKPSATSRPVMPRIPTAMIPPVSFEPSRLPTSSGSWRHRTGLHLQFAPFTGPPVFTRSSPRVVGHPHVEDAPEPAAQRVTARRSSTPGGPAPSTSCKSCHLLFLSISLSPPYTSRPQRPICVWHTQYGPSLNYPQNASSPAQSPRTATTSGSYPACGAPCRRR